MWIRDSPVLRQVPAFPPPPHRLPDLIYMRDGSQTTSRRLAPPISPPQTNLALKNHSGANLQSNVEDEEKENWLHFYFVGLEGSR